MRLYGRHGRVDLRGAGVGGAHEVFTLSAVDVSNNLLTPSAPLSRVYSSQARVAAVVRRTYYLDASGKRLMMYDGGRSDVPLVDHVVDLRFVLLRRSTARVGASSRDRRSELRVCRISTGVRSHQSGRTKGQKCMTAALLTDGPACGEHPYTFDADLLRIRRVSCTIRVGGRIR